MILNQKFLWFSLKWANKFHMFDRVTIKFNSCTTILPTSIARSFGRRKKKKSKWNVQCRNFVGLQQKLLLITMQFCFGFRYCYSFKLGCDCFKSWPWFDRFIDPDMSQLCLVMEKQFYSPKHWCFQLVVFFLFASNFQQNYANFI